MAYPSRKHQARRRSSTAATWLVAIAGAAVAASTASAIQVSRQQLGWLDLAAFGRGQGITVGNLELGHVFTEHNGFTAPIIKIFWDGDNLGEDREAFVDPHATASASAIAGNSNLVPIAGLPPIQGIAPNVDLILSGGLSSGFQQGQGGTGGFFGGLTNTALAYTLFAMTDREVANIAAARLGIPQYEPATVVNLGFGSAMTRDELQGEDIFSRTCNAVATMTGATLVAGAGDDRDNPAVPGQDDSGTQPDQGTINAPASAHNVISVAYADDELNTIADDSSEGPNWATEWIFVSDLLYDDSQFPLMPPEFQDPSTAEIPMARTGVDITAPGTMLSLLDSPINNDPDLTLRDPNAFSQFWIGSSFASAMVAGACALIHDVGIQTGYWSLDPNSDLPRPHWTITKAILLNAANKEDFISWQGNIGEGMGLEEGVCVNPQSGNATLDTEQGAGMLDFRRIVEQLRSNMRTPRSYADIRPNEQFVLDGKLRTLQGFTRERNLGDPADPLDRFREPPPLPMSDTGIVRPLMPMENPPPPTDLNEDPDDPFSPTNWLADFNVPASGTDPDVPFVTFWIQDDEVFSIPSGGLGGMSGTVPTSPLSDAERIALRGQVEENPTPQHAEIDPDINKHLTLGERYRPNGQPRLGTDGDPRLFPDSRVEGATFNSIGISSEGSTDQGGSRSTARQIKTGWDHGRLGVGFIDLPLGTVTPGSEITITLCWERQEIWDRFQLNSWAFDQGSGAIEVTGDMTESIIPQAGRQVNAPVHPTGQIALAQENFDLELYREGVGGEPVLVAVSRNERDNVEHLFIGGDVADCGGDADSEVPIRFGDYFIRVRYSRTFFDFGGFRWATGIQSLQQQHRAAPPSLQGEFRNLWEGEAVYGVAWRVELESAPGEPISFSGSAPGGDLNSSGVIDAEDLSALLMKFGSDDEWSDLNGNGVVDGADLGIILRNYGQKTEDILSQGG